MSQVTRSKRAVRAVLVKSLFHCRDDRGMRLIEHETRCVRAGEVHEVVTTDQDAGPGDRVDRVGFLGFAETVEAGVIERGDPFWVGDRPIGTVLGFDECHFPNHYNVLIRTDRQLTADDLGLAPEDRVSFGAPVGELRHREETPTIVATRCEPVSGIAALLNRLASGETLSFDQARSAVGLLLAGRCTEDEAGAFLMALRLRGETAEELFGGAMALRDVAVRFDPPVSGLLDTCGTGGDGASTFNISTAAAVVAAACGVPVAKHGNRSATGVSGSADVLEALGVDVEAPPDMVGKCLRKIGFGFVYTPLWHPTVRRLAPLRRRLGFRTLFNLLGPLANPAGATFQLVGTGRIASADALAQALARLAATATVVTGSDGLDEVTLSGATRAACIRDGQVEILTWTPEDFGLPRARKECWRVGSATESATVIADVLSGRAGPARDIVLANAAAALWTAGRVSTLHQGVDLAISVIDSGAARHLLDELARCTSRPRVAEAR